MPHARINDLELYYEDIGSGPPLLCIAGLGSDSSIWQPLISRVGKHLRLILPDNRGAGRTEPKDVPISIEKMADDCAELIRHLNLPSACLLGHSMGGMIALSCGLRHPGMVDKLILSGTAPRTGRRNQILFRTWCELLHAGTEPRLWLTEVYAWVFTRCFFDTPANLENAIRQALNTPHPQPVKSFEAQVEAIADYDAAPELSRVATATLILCGAQDLLIPPDESAALTAIPNSRLTIIPDAAHAIAENPAEYARVVLEFVKNSEAGSLS